MAVTLFTACSETNDEPSAETEVKVDLDETKAAMKDGLEKAGDKLEEGARKAEAGLEKAGEKLEEGWEKTKDKLDGDKEIKIEVKKD